MLAKDEIIGRLLHDRYGRVIGRVTAFYRYPAELDAPWGMAAVTYRRMILVNVTNLVDLRDAVLQDGAVVAAYTSELITSAPNHQPLIGNTLSSSDAASVRAHYRKPRVP